MALLRTHAHNLHRAGGALYRKLPCLSLAPLDVPGHSGDRGFLPGNAGQEQIPGKGAQGKLLGKGPGNADLPGDVPAGELLQLREQLRRDFHFHPLLQVLQGAQRQQAAVPAHLQHTARRGQGKPFPLFQGAGGVLRHGDKGPLPRHYRHGSSSPADGKALHSILRGVPGGLIGVLPRGNPWGSQLLQPKPAGGRTHLQHPG